MLFFPLVRISSIILRAVEHVGHLTSRSKEYFNDQILQNKVKQMIGLSIGSSAGNSVLLKCIIRKKSEILQGCVVIVSEISLLALCNCILQFYIGTSQELLSPQDKDLLQDLPFYFSENVLQLTHTRPTCFKEMVEIILIVLPYMLFLLLA